MTNEHATDRRAAHRDRRGRLILFGSATLGMGLLSVLLGLAHLGLPALNRRLGLPEEGADATAVAMSVSLYVLIGIGLAGLGLGSIRQRRWVPAIFQAAAWTWLLVGLSVVAFVAWTADDLMLLASPDSGPVPPEAAWIVRLLLLLVFGLPGVLYPLLLLAVYRDPHLAETCRRASPTRSGQTEVPLPVLVLAFALEAAALLSLPMVLRPVVPVFGELWTGAAGAGALLGGIAACAWLGERVYRRRWTGWWGTTLLLLAFGVSCGWTAWAVAPADWYRALGYPTHALDAPEAGPTALSSTGLLAVTAVLTVASLLYMLGIRRQFHRQT